MDNIRTLLEKLNIKYKNIKYYHQALTHSSYVNENPFRGLKNYETLEILGDAIISKIVIEYFFKKYNNNSEVEINDSKKMVVCGKTMVMASNDLELSKYLLVGKGIDKNNISEKIKEDIFESFIGALYLDLGEKACQTIIYSTIINYYINGKLDLNIDYKTRIQEIFQSKEYHTGNKNKNGKIHYRVLEERDNNFLIQLEFDSMIYGIGNGRTKKDAEQQAAKDAYKKLAL